MKAREIEGTKRFREKIEPISSQRGEVAANERKGDSVRIRLFVSVFYFYIFFLITLTLTHFHPLSVASVYLRILPRTLAKRVLYAFVRAAHKSMNPGEFLR